MREKTLVVIGILLLSYQFSFQVPPEYELWYKAWDAFLDEIAQPPTVYNQMKFGTNLITTNPQIAIFPEAYRQGTIDKPVYNELEANVFDYWNLDANLKLIDLFGELNVDYVKVMMRYPNDLIEKENYHQIFEHIRSHGFELLIRHDVMGLEYLYIDPKAEDAFEKEKEKRRAFIYDVVAQYQPEYLELPEGPTGFQSLLRMLPDIRRWLDEVSPKTKIIIMEGIVYDYQVEKFKTIVDNPYVDIVSIHLTELIYPPYRERLEEMVSYAKLKNKTLWSTDTWLSDGGFAYHGPSLTPPGYEPFTFENIAQWLHDGEYEKVIEKLDIPWREPLDARWQGAIVNYSQKLGFQSVCPFHVQYFIDYDTSFYTPLGTNISSWQKSLENGKHTTVFHAYKNIIQRVRNNTKNLSVNIEKPTNGYFYAFDRKITRISSEKTLIIGRITIEANAYGDISKVEFYIDDKLKATDDECPYSWLWDEYAMGEHGIKVIAYDIKGNSREDKMDVIIFNFG